MAWIAVDDKGNEGIFANCPVRRDGQWWDLVEEDNYSYDTELFLPKGSIKKLIGRNLTWEDEPVELKEE